MLESVEGAFRERTVPVVVADSDGFITFVNDRFEETFGWKREEVLGKPLTILIPPRFRDAHHMGLAAGGFHVGCREVCAEAVLLGVAVQDQECLHG